jgi:hypothetical protein
VKSESALEPEPLLEADPPVEPEPLLEPESVAEPEPVIASEPEAAPDPVGNVAPAPTPQPPALMQPPVPELVDFGERCEQCGAELGEDDIFCGACGRVTRSASSHFSRPRDTVIIEAVQLERNAQAAAAAPSIVRGAETNEGVHVPDPLPRLGQDHDLGDVEETRIVRQHGTGARFVLQFSTGESVTVHGNGLVGRNPRPEPAEYFDHLVRVLDPSRSVSKTHLEFGQEVGAFWIKDRFSGNGSTIREPEGDPVNCQPDRRYRVVRGTRVEIGEQFFIVS